MMKTKLGIATLILTCSVVGGLSSCSKKETELSPIAANKSADVQTIDGRLVFKDSDSYVRTLESLKFNSPEDLARWEKTMKFSSLRAGVNDNEVALKEEFRFPGFISAVINKQGVYQVGEKLYWYHAHKMHEFNNLTDLVLAQSGQNVVHKSFEAGCVKSRIAERTIGSNSSRDGLYQYDFCLAGNCGSRRKIIYEIYSYTQQLTDFPNYYAALVFSAKLEYRSRDRWKVAGDSRQVIVSLGGPVSIYTPFGLSAQPSASVQYNNVSNSDVELTISAREVAGYDQSQFGWDFALGGTITSYVSGYQSQPYVIQGTNLW
ncbi:hypothetical protein [Hymenobacter terrenus]|uniref:hypothetical protein n=1 Tax=Hymenobacter terrenus TaxID=1629124 RepID=UPI000AAD2A27|nr:hypothetical protein [Hymenobacter terrenus]